jgi:hypothetical protein
MLNRNYWVKKETGRLKSLCWCDARLKWPIQNIEYHCERLRLWNCGKFKVASWKIVRRRKRRYFRVLNFKHGNRQCDYERYSR